MISLAIGPILSYGAPPPSIRSREAGGHPRRFAGGRSAPSKGPSGPGALLAGRMPRRRGFGPMVTSRRVFLGSLLAPATLALLAACGPSAPQATSGGAPSTPAPTPVPSKPGAVAAVNPVPTAAPAAKP